MKNRGVVRVAADREEKRPIEPHGHRGHGLIGVGHHGQILKVMVANEASGLARAREHLFPVGGERRHPGRDLDRQGQHQHRLEQPIRGTGAGLPGVEPQTGHRQDEIVAEVAPPTRVDGVLRDRHQQHAQEIGDGQAGEPTQPDQPHHQPPGPEPWHEGIDAGPATEEVIAAGPVP